MRTAHAGQRSNSEKKAVLSVYLNYDLTGGGPPFGHVRTTHVEVSFGRKTVARNGDGGEALKRHVEKHGVLVGKREHLPCSRDYSDNSYKQEYLVPLSWGPKSLEKEILVTPVLRW